MGCCCKPTKINSDLETSSYDYKNNTINTETKLANDKFSEMVKNKISKLSIATITPEFLTRNKNTTFTSREGEERYQKFHQIGTTNRSSVSDERFPEITQQEVPSEIVKENYLKYAHKVFDEINNFRSKPQLYIPKLKKIIDSIKQDIDTICYLELDGMIYKFKQSLESINNFYDFLLKFPNEKILVPEIPIVWSDEIYQHCLEYIISGENDIKILNNRLLNDEEDQKILLTLNIGSGQITEETKLLIMLLEDPKIKEFFLTKTFNFGAVCFMYSKENDQKIMKSVIVLKDKAVKMPENPELVEKEIFTSSPKHLRVESKFKKSMSISSVDSDSKE